MPEPIVASPFPTEVEKVVVIATHASSLHARACVLQRAQRRQPLRKESRLYLRGNLQFLSCATLGLQPFGGGAALRFNRSADLIETDERERVPIDILEAGKHATPHR